LTASSASADLAARSWRRIARRLSWRVNVAAWWERWTTPAVVASALAAGTLLTLRRQGTETRWLWLGLAAVLLVMAALAAGRARRFFFSTAAALTELDVALGLKTRLTAASAGVGAWPEPPSRRPAVLRWRPKHLLVPPAFAAALLAVAGFIPVSKARAPRAVPGEAPAAWREMDQWLTALKQEDLAKPDAVDAWEERVNRLRKQPESTWYAHGSLEAGDTLHQQLEVGLRSMGNDLDDAADALEMMESNGGQSHDANGGTERQLDRAMQRLEAGSVPLNPSVLSRLKAAKGHPRPLSMAEMEKLSKRLREGAGFCRLQVRECPFGHKECHDPHCRRGGKPARGPGEAPLTLESEASKTGGQRLEGVANEDMQNAALGDTIGISRGAHSVDRHHPVTPIAGGAVAGAAGGGEAVWRDTLTPEEQRLLQRYFK
jgi:hypothetical protein